MIQYLKFLIQLSQTSIGTSTLPDGGVVIARGNMGYWESNEKYPDNKADIWNSSSQCWTNVPPSTNVWDLCGKPIRHHKFPDNALSSETYHFTS
jgi:hypothetical protein